MTRRLFSDTFTCNSCGYCDELALDETGLILLPEDVLNTIAQQNETIPPVMLFCIKNIRHGTELYAGVKSFTMAQGRVCLPYWMMEFLQCSENDRVNISLVYLPKATRALFQPLDSNFFDIPNTKVVLEFKLRQYPVLTQGTVLQLVFNDKVYKLKVLKLEPSNAVQTIHADVVCDFATPVTEFTHHWNDPDTDSSDDEAAKPTVIKGHLLKGKTIERVEEPKPLHSTFASREEERLHGHVFRTKEIVAGQEILPPKPKEKMKEKKVDFFQGGGHILNPKKARGKGAKSSQPTKSKEKGAKSSSMSTSASEQSITDEPSASQKPQPKASVFFGVGRTTGGLSVMGEAQPPKQPEPEPEPEPKQSSYFTGASNSVKRSVLEPQNQTKPSKPTPTQTPPPQNSTSTSKYFQGPSNRMKH